MIDIPEKTVDRTGHHVRPLKVSNAHSKPIDEVTHGVPQQRPASDQCQHTGDENSQWRGTTRLDDAGDDRAPRCRQNHEDGRFPFSSAVSDGVVPIFPGPGAIYVHNGRSRRSDGTDSRDRVEKAKRMVICTLSKLSNCLLKIESVAKNSYPFVGEIPGGCCQQ
jgi:hypothetical protein